MQKSAARRRKGSGRESWRGEGHWEPADNRGPAPMFVAPEASRGPRRTGRGLRCSGAGKSGSARIRRRFSGAGVRTRGVGRLEWTACGAPPLTFVSTFKIDVDTVKSEKWNFIAWITACLFAVAPYLFSHGYRYGIKTLDKSYFFLSLEQIRDLLHSAKSI